MYFCVSEILLAVVDTKSQSVLMEYCWPWAYLQPFHHYYLELIINVILSVFLSFRDLAGGGRHQVSVCADGVLLALGLPTALPPLPPGAGTGRLLVILLEKKGYGLVSARSQPYRSRPEALLTSTFIRFQIYFFLEFYQQNDLAGLDS